MTTVFVTVLLVAHGLNHLVVWLSRRSAADVGPTALVPEHAGPLSAVGVPASAMRRVTEALAVTTAAAFVLAGTAAGLGFAEALPLAVAGATTGLFLKAPYFHTWVALGAVVDVLVLAMALAAWPMALVER